MLRWLGLERVAPSPGETGFKDWWRRANRRTAKEMRRGLNSLVILTACEIWKHRKPAVHLDSDQDNSRRSTAVGDGWIGAKKLGQVIG